MSLKTEIQANIMRLATSLKKPGASKFFKGDDEHKLMLDLLRIAYVICEETTGKENDGSFS